MDLEKNQEIGQIRFDYLSILNKSDHHWKIFRSRMKGYIDNCTIYTAIAYQYYIDEDYDKSLNIYDLARANDSTCTLAYGNIGWIYYLKGKFDKCIEFSEKAIRLDPTALYAHYNIALSHLCLGEFDKAKSKYEMTIKLNRDLGEDIHKGAIEDLQNLIKRDHKKAEAEIILTDFFKVGDTKKPIPAKAK
jgi:tetratricopeptide (TPR) repeat protein